MQKWEKKLSGEARELIQNADTVSDWIYQRKDFDHEILIRIFNQLIVFLGNTPQKEQEWKDAFTQSFSGLTSAYEAKDLILVADILHHDFRSALLEGELPQETALEPKPVSDTQERENREAFLQRYGIELPKFHDEKNRFAVEAAKDGSRILYVTEGGQRIRMNSLYDPSYEAMRWAAQYGDLVNVKTTIAINGLLEGYYLRALRLTVRDNVDFIIYEPSMELFLYVCQNFSLADIIEDPRVRIVLPQLDEDAFYRELSGSTSRIHTNIFGITTPGYVQDERFAKVCHQVNIMDEMDRGYREHRGKESFRSEIFAFCNLDRNYLASDLFHALPRDVPVFIVSGGPSLLKNIDELKRIKDKGLIVAVDRAVSVLVRYGIMPDIMVTIDPVKDPGFLDYEEVRNVYLMCGFGANGMTMRKYNGRLIMIHSDVRYNEIPGLDGRLMSFGDVGGGVATAAFLHFVYMKMDDVVLVGQDLAYEKGALTHADGIDNTGNKVPDIEVDGIYGGKVHTTWDYNRALEFFERTMQLYPESRVTDATEGGALIHGTRVQSLKDTVDELCAKGRDINGILSSMPNAQTAEQHEETIEYMCSRIKELRIIKALCPELCEITRKLVNACKYGQIGEKGNIRKINHYNEIRNRIYPLHVNDWLEEFWVTDRNTVPNPYIVVRTNEEAYPVFVQANRYYTTLPEFCDSLEQAIREESGITEEEYDRRMTDAE